MVLLNNIRFAAKKSTKLAKVVDKSSLVIGPFKTAAQMTMKECTQELNVPAARPYHPCSVFFDRTLNKFILKGMRKGQRVLMQEMMREVFTIIKRNQLNRWNKCTDNEERSKIICDPLAVFHGALENCKPLLITRPVKRGGATYQVPFPVRERESEELAMRWLFQTIKERPKPRKTFFPEAMAQELIDCYYNRGKVVKKKLDIYRQCESNKAYAHYRWG